MIVYEKYSPSLWTSTIVLFAAVQKKLEKLREQQNPNLEELASTILQHIEDAGDDSEGFRILLFVRTRATCRALCRWLNSKNVDPRLRSLNAQHFTGTGAHQEHGGQFDSLTTVLGFFLGGEEVRGDIRVIFVIVCEFVPCFCLMQVIDFHLWEASSIWVVLKMKCSCLDGWWQGVLCLNLTWLGMCAPQSWAEQCRRSESK